MSDRRLLLVVSTVAFVDTLFYAVLAPLLPGLAHTLHLSKLSAGILTAGYPIGCLVGSIPGGLLVTRIGPRATICLGLSLLVASTLAFGLLRTIVALDIARVVEGWGGACSWAGGLAWLVAGAPESQRGGLIGKALGAAIAGALFGPVVGTIATATGRTACFGGLAAIEALLVTWTLTLPERRGGARRHLRDALAVMRRRDVVLGMWLVGLPAIGSGAVNVLGPLRLHRLGAPAAVIGLVFLLAAGLEAVLSPVAGRLSDSYGRVIPLRLGLLLAALVSLLFTLPGGVAWLGVVILLITAALGIFWAPAMAMLSDSVERHHVDQAIGAALMNLGWAGGQIVGSGGGGAVARFGGDELPMAIVAALCALTLAGLSRGRAPAGAAPG